MPYLRKQKALFINSSGVDTTLNGSAFSIAFKPSWEIPLNYTNFRLAATEVAVWNTFVNISASKNNNKLYIKHGVLDYVITVLNGQYSLDELNDALDDLLVAATLPTGILKLESFAPQQKVVVVLTQPNYQLDFT